MKQKKLTQKQDIFCREYVKDYNATRAYIRAGYSATEQVARREAHKLLTNPDIQARVTDLTQARNERTEIEGDKVLKEIARIAFASITDVIDFDDHGIFVKDSLQLSDDVKAAVAEVTVHESERGIKRSVKMHDKNKSLALLMKYLGLDSDFNTAIATLKKYGLNLYQSDSGWQVKDENV